MSCGSACGVVREFGFKGIFGDKRIERLASLLVHRMSEKLTVTIRKLAESRNFEVAFSRLIGNTKFSMESIIRGAVSKTELLSRDCKHILIVQDTTDLYFEIKDKGFREGLGQVGNDKGMGFHLHPGLAIDAESGNCLGLSSLYYWVREKSEGSRINKKCWRQKVPIEQKESYRWIENAKESKKNLPTEILKTIIADRESDIYEEWARIPDERTNLFNSPSSNNRKARG